MDTVENASTKIQSVVRGTQGRMTVENKRFSRKQSKKNQINQI